MKKEQTEGGKKEGNNIQEIEKKYGLDKYKKSEFLKQMEKEFTKIDKKLVKINNYEKMKSEGKHLNSEMEEVIAKKEQFLLSIKAYKTALDAYQRVDSATENTPQPKSAKDIESADVINEESKTKGFTSAEPKKVYYFLAIIEVLKAEVSPNPLSNLSEEQKDKLLKTINRITNPKEFITLAAMAAEISNVIASLSENEELSDILDQIMKDNEVTGMKFRFTSAKSPSTGAQPTAEPKAAIKKQFKEESEPVKEKSVPIKEYNEPKKETTWADDESNEADENEEKEERKKLEGSEDDGFETVLSREDARKLKEEGPSNRGRGRGRRGRGRGRDWDNESERRPRRFRNRRGGN